MRKLFIGFIYVLSLSFVFGNKIYADTLTKSEKPLQAIFKGKALIVDMDANDEVGQQTFLSGKDLILVKIVSILPKKKGECLQFKIIALSQLKELINIDLNHDGIISKDEMVKANIALLRYNHSGDIIIDHLGDSLIKQISYQKDKDGTVNIILVTDEDKKFKGYFIDL